MKDAVNVCAKSLLLSLKTLGVFLVAFLVTSQQLWPQEASPNDSDAFTKTLEAIVAMPQAEKVPAFVRLANISDLSLSGVQLSMTVGDRLNKAPKELAGGWTAGADSEPKVRRIAGSNVTLQMNIQKAMICWSLFLDAAPQEAFTAMLSRTDTGRATLADAARILAATERKPGQQLKQQVPKAVWKRIHESSNPCSKILALEKYDSTEQSPAELLGLYRECLLDSFGYLQVRALEGIYRSKDFRPEVAALLKEYLNSNPAADDGTLPAFPAIIGNPVEGAKMILAEMSKAGSVNTTLSKSLPSTASSAVTPLSSAQLAAPKKALEAKPTTSLPSQEPLTSTPWSIFVVLILAATSLLWLLLKNRK